MIRLVRHRAGLYRCDLGQRGLWWVTRWSDQWQIRRGTSDGPVATTIVTLRDAEDWLEATP